MIAINQNTCKLKWKAHYFILSMLQAEIAVNFVLEIWLIDALCVITAWLI